MVRVMSASGQRAVMLSWLYTSVENRDVRILQDLQLLLYKNVAFEDEIWQLPKWMKVILSRLIKTFK